MIAASFLPGTGMWRAEGVTEGLGAYHASSPPSPSTMLCMVPLPVPGRN
jgi:hypothetical protein